MILYYITLHSSFFIVAYTKKTSRNHYRAVTMSGYECRNRRVFSLRRNTGVTSSGRLFQTLGPAEANGQNCMAKYTSMQKNPHDLLCYNKMISNDLINCRKLCPEMWQQQHYKSSVHGNIVVTYHFITDGHYCAYPF